MKRATVLTLLILVWLLLVPVTQAQGGYDLDWWTADGGGDMSPAGTGYSLSGTVGQPDAATWQGASGYTLSGGFWVTGPAMDGYEVFLPLVIRGSGP